MALPIEDLTPRQIVIELDRYIVGQAQAKRAVAVALRNRYRRQQVPPEERDEILPKNILMIGPTGVGKTEIARRLAQLARAPFIKIEATKFTEVGYVGRDVESMIRDLAASAVRLVEKERMDAIRPQAEQDAIKRIAEMLDQQMPRPKRKKEAVADSQSDNPLVSRAMDVFGDDDFFEPEDEEARLERIKRIRKLCKEIEQGKHDDESVEIEFEEAANPFVQVFTPQGMEEMGLDFNLSNSFQNRRGSKRVTVGEARGVLIEQEAKRAIDQASVNREAVLRAEQTGIVFLDEIDKIAAKSGGSGPDVSREGVQRDLLPIIEGSTVASKFGPIRTDHILFIAAGAFHISKPSDLIPELQGRLPIRVELENLTADDFRRILSEPQNALVKQYASLLKVEGAEIIFEESAIAELANLAADVNSKTENIGARRLHTLMEKLLETELFDAPENVTKRIVFDAKEVRNRLSTIVGDADLSRYIL